MKTSRFLSENVIECVHYSLTEDRMTLSSVYLLVPHGDATHNGTAAVPVAP